MKIEEKQKNAKTRLIEAFDQSTNKSVSEIARIAGLSRHTFYDYFNQDVQFRKQILLKKQKHLSQRIAATI